MPQGLKIPHCFFCVSTLASDEWAVWGCSSLALTTRCYGKDVWGRGKDVQTTPLQSNTTIDSKGHKTFLGVLIIS